MAKTEIDRDKLCVRLSGLRKDELLALLDRAVEPMPRSRFSTLVKGYVKPAGIRADTVARGGLVGAVTKFRDASLQGEYYEDFMVNSRNFMEKFRGTATWIAESERLFERRLTIR